MSLQHDSFKTESFLKALPRHMICCKKQRGTCCPPSTASPSHTALLAANHPGSHGIAIAIATTVWCPSDQSIFILCRLVRGKTYSPLVCFRPSCPPAHSPVGLSQFNRLPVNGCHSEVQHQELLHQKVEHKELLHHMYNFQPGRELWIADSETPSLKCMLPSSVIVNDGCKYYWLIKTKHTCVKFI